MRLRPATMNDRYILWCWRNDKVTRQNSHSTELVSIEAHTAWLESSIANPSRLLYIAENDGLPVGTCRADKDEHGYELSWTIAPKARGKGFGKLMLSALVAILPPPFRAEIKVGNIASVRIAESIGLHLQSERDGILYYS